MAQADREKVNNGIPVRFVIDRETGQIVSAVTAEGQEEQFEKILAALCRMTEDARRQRAC